MVDYDPKFAQRLIAHMGKGLSFGSFAGEIGCHRRTLNKWLEAHPEFHESRKIGKAALRLYLEKLGLRIANGSLVRLAREEPVMDARGNPIFDATGKVVSKRYFMPVNGNPTAWIFAMKNHCGWRNEPRFSVSVNQQQNVAVKNEIASMTNDDMDGEIRALEATIQLGQKKVIDHALSADGQAAPIATQKRKGAALS